MRALSRRVFQLRRGDGDQDRNHDRQGEITAQHNISEDMAALGHRRGRSNRARAAWQHHMDEAAVWTGAAAQATRWWGRHLYRRACRRRGCRIGHPGPAPCRNVCRRPWVLAGGRLGEVAGTVKRRLLATGRACRRSWRVAVSLAMKQPKAPVQTVCDAASPVLVAIIEGAAGRLTRSRTHRSLGRDAFIA